MRDTCGASCTGGPPSITDEIASSASEIAARSGSSDIVARRGVSASALDQCVEAVLSSLILEGNSVDSSCSICTPVFDRST